MMQNKIDAWQTEQGLPFETVQCMLQSRDGTLWVGTTGGLARFDGLRFETFESSAAPKPIAGPIFGFFEDAQGAMWIGHSRGAIRFQHGRFESVFDSEITDGRRVWAFAQARDGVIWAATENGLVRWDNGQTKVFKVADGLPTIRLRTLDFDQDGILWIGTSGGGLVSYANGQFKVFNPASGFPHLEVRHVLADGAGGMWAATAGAGLVLMQGARITRYTATDGLPTDQLTYLARDKAGALWIGTWGAGISRMKDGQFSSIASASGLAGDHIWSMHVDREGSVWVGTWNNGLNRVSQRPFGVLGKREGLSHDNVRAVILARDGAVWATSAGGGINRIADGRVATITKKDGLLTDEASSLLEARDGSIWIGTYTAGVARLRNGELEPFGTAKGLPNLDVRALLEDRAGTLWVGTNAGLARFTGQGFTPVRDAGAPREGVTAILEDRAGVLWIGTAGQGLVRYQNGVFSTLTKNDGLVSNWIFALYEDAAGSLWIGTNGAGMNRLREGRISSIRVDDGLWDGSVQVIIEDKLGGLWMTCNRGIYRVMRAELDAFSDGKIAKVNSTGFGPGNVLRSATFAGGLQPAGAIDAKGHIWFPSLKGLVIVDPSNLPGAEAPPPVTVTKVSINGLEAATDTAVALPAGSVPLAIRYNAGTLRNADRVRFRYLMEGNTKDWIEAGQSREASFPTLPYGNYRFRVAASIDGKRWQEASRALPISVKPHYYQTPWFFALALLGAFGAAIGVYRLRTHQLHSRQAEMERVVAEKTEELRLANEHLSKLSFADALTGLANRRRLDETLDTEWRRASRSHTALAIVIVDIDSFKSYNDALGHPEGDQCLIAVGEVIRQGANRAGDFAARYGGEEFFVVLPGMEYSAAKDWAEKLRQACEARAIPHPASPVGPVVTISLGVAACIPSAERSIESLISEADAALYRAKHEGRNRVR
jgi:diguanylate cyclase (GGDEF)-like protein